MKPDRQNFENVTGPTLEFYGQNADDFWDGTRNHDVRQNIEALLRHIRGEPPFAILDLGCGPGRDLKTFRERGHIAIGVEGTAPFVEMAREYSGCEVWQQDFLKLSLPEARFDGIFANASLFHVPTRELPRVLGELSVTLKPGGVLFSSNPRGDNREGWRQAVTASTTILTVGGAISLRLGLANSNTTTAQPGCRAKSSHGSRRCGASRTNRAALRGAIYT